MYRLIEFFIYLQRRRNENNSQRFFCFYKLLKIVIFSILFALLRSPVGTSLLSHNREKSATKPCCQFRFVNLPDISGQNTPLHLTTSFFAVAYSDNFKDNKLSTILLNNGESKTIRLAYQTRLYCFT